MVEPQNKGPVEFVVEHGLGILAVVAALSYAIVRPAYERFYAQLGLTPEDIGLTQVAVISRGAASVALIGATIALPFLIGFTMYLSVRGRRGISQGAIVGSLAIMSGLLFLWLIDKEN